MLGSGTTKQLRGHAPAARAAGKGSVRRRVKRSRPAPQQDTRCLTKIGGNLQLSTVANVLEVAMLKEDGECLLWSNPSVQANLNANTYIIQGTPVAIKAAPDHSDPDFPDRADPDIPDVATFDVGAPDLIPI